MRQFTLIATLWILGVTSPNQSSGFELIAHRGVYQNYDRADAEGKTCTADKIFPPSHPFLENTLPSMQMAFDLGATMVELDIHPTTEADAIKDRLVVFHDWELQCITNASCKSGCKCNQRNECDTNQQEWAYLRQLDIGFGYTSDRVSFPFRGKGIGLMPTFKEAVSLLERNPDKKLLVNVKDRYDRTQALLLRELAEFSSEVRSRVFVEFQKKYESDFLKLSVPEAIWQTAGMEPCFRDLIQAKPGSADFPVSCRNRKFFIPLHQDMGRHDPKLKGIELVALIPGWPDRFLENAAADGAMIYLSQVNSEADLHFAQTHHFRGIMTDRIEIIGPLLETRHHNNLIHTCLRKMHLGQ